jgi:hypothetical protein
MSAVTFIQCCSPGCEASLSVLPNDLLVLRHADFVVRPSGLVEPYMIAVEAVTKCAL